MNASPSTKGVFKVLWFTNVFQEGSWRIDFRVHLPSSVWTASFLLASLVALYSTPVNLAVLFLHLKSGCNVSARSLWGLLLEAEVITFLRRIRGCLYQGWYFCVREGSLWQLVCYFIWTIYFWAQRLIVGDKWTIGTCFIEGSLVFATWILGHLTRLGKVRSLIRTHLIWDGKLVIRVSSVGCRLPLITEYNLTIWNIEWFGFIWLESQ